MQPKRTVPSVARAIVAHLKAHGSPEHAAGVQWFFKEAIQSHGWYTAPLRRYAREVHRALSPEPGLLMEVASALFTRTVLDGRVGGVAV